MNKHLLTDTFFVDKIDEIEFCESKYYQFTGSSFKRATDFKRIENQDHNLNNCERCKKSHEQTIKNLNNRFKKFPNCCSHHMKLLNQDWFNKDEYKDIAKLTADKIFYTWHFILKNIDTKDWEEEITDYLQYIIYTFGSFPSDCGEPLFLSTFFQGIKELVKTGENINEIKKKIILDNLDSYFLTNKNTDLNILLSIYNQWYKTFPFELSIFQNLKESFSKSFPIIEKTHFNKYLNVEIATPLSKQNLIKLLTNITNKIVTELNSLKLYEEGKLSDLENYILQLTVQKRKLQLLEGYTNNSKNPDTRYRNILKAWLRDELDFVKIISQTFKDEEKIKQNLFQDILFACSKMQENKIFWNVDEDTRTKQILDLLELNYNTKDQTKQGISGTGKKPGSIDGLIIDKKNIEYIIEALNLQSLNKEYIKTHINKLEKNYDSKGLKNKFIIIYCNISRETFNSFYEKYYKLIESEIDFIFQITCIEKLDSNYINQKIIKTKHKREELSTSIYHILLNMPNK